MRESGVQQRTQIALASLGAQVWRNNVGACVDETGRMIRYGLANDSAQLNRVIKSSDLIACVPVVIQPHHVGQLAGLFGAFEIKAPGWHLTPGDQRGQAQAKFIELVRSVGGIGGFVTDPQQVHGMIPR